MASQSSLFWTAASIAIAFIAVRWYQQPPPGDVEEVGEAEHEFNALVDRQRQENDGQRGEDAPAGGIQQDQREHPDGADVGAAWDNDDRARRALEERQAAQAAQEPERVNAWKQRGDVGAKKAKSLAKRDQRRAYYEYVRQEAEHRREEIKRFEEAFGDLIAKEREERQRKIDAAKAEIEEYNNYRRQLEEEDRNDRRERRERITEALKTTGKAKLEDDDYDTDVEIAESITGAIVLENEEYAVAVTPQLVSALTSQLSRKGRISLEEVREQLENVY